MYRVLLAALCVLLGTFGVGTYAQCDTVLQLNGDLVLPTEGTTCIQCVDGAGVPQIDILVQWEVNGVPFFATENFATPEANGELQITNSTGFISGNNGAPVEVGCDFGNGVDDHDIYIEGFFAPTLTETAVTLNEEERLTVTCVNTNAPNTVQLEWLNPAGEVIQSLSTLNVFTIMRSQAGAYTCRLSLIANMSMSKNESVQVTVNYPPGIVSDSPMNGLVELRGQLSLGCTWDSVPDSAVTWALNNSPLTGGANVVINSNDKTSTLMISPVGTDNGGDYTCTADNGIGAPASATVSRTVQVEPDRATSLTASNIQETSLDLTWMNGFDGFSDITDVRVQLFVGGLSVRTDTIGVVESTTLTGLDPFTLYTIEVIVVNVIGDSLPITTDAMTLSLFLEAPTMVTLTSPTSQSLLLDWEPPLAAIATTSPPTNWTIELFNAGGMSIRTGVVSLTEFLFEQLDKGVVYSARVAGLNVRGMGAYSNNVTAQTLVDPPSVPLSLEGMGVSAFGFSADWSLPMDNGGRPVTSYTVTYSPAGSVDTGSVEVTEGTELLLRNGGEPMPTLPLVNNTMYDVEVRAVNEAGPGDPATITLTTQSLDQPQPIFEVPEASSVSNLSATVTWQVPDGEVVVYEVEYKMAMDSWGTGAVFMIEVPGNITTVQLPNLVPESAYDVRVRTRNDLGVSVYTMVQRFTTLLADAPLVEGPVMATAGNRVQINCSSSLNIPELPLTWYTILPGAGGSQRTVAIAECACSARVVGTDLVFDSALDTDSGAYLCSLGSASTRHDINIVMRPPPEAISMEVIIIVAVVGGVALIVFLLVLVLACYCTCCSKSERSKGYSKTNVKSSKASKSKDKRSKAGRSRNNWIETSTKFVPNTTPSYARTADEPSPFDMPEDLTTHSSFNTLEKQNKIRRGESPGDGFGSSNV